MYSHKIRFPEKSRNLFHCPITPKIFFLFRKNCFMAIIKMHLALIVQYYSKSSLKLCLFSVKLFLL